MLRQLIELVAPAHCLSCGREGAELCVDCAATKLPLRHASCLGCNRLTPDNRLCTACRRQSPIAGVVVGAYYEGPVKELILGLKFNRSVSAARVAAGLIAARLAATNQSFDLVTAIPVAPARYRERGYNQAELIARHLARQLGLPYRTTLRRATTDHQLGHSRAERLEQIQGVFEPIRPLKAPRLLVVDDVLTTGATLTEAARVLREAGAGTIWGAAVARH